MKPLIREAAIGLLIRLSRAVTCLIICLSLRRPLPPNRQPVPPAIVTPPVMPLDQRDQRMQWTAAEVERAARVKLGWPPG